VSVARFLKTCPSLDKELVGTYLSYPKDVPKYAFHGQVRRAFMASFDFSGQSIVEALRTLLDCFRLPGEAQKIEVLMEEFSKAYFKHSPGPMAEADTAFVLSYSIIMLNTDLHNPSVHRKMRLDQFIKNNRGINADEDLPVEYLTSIYNEIAEKEIVLQPDAAAVQSGGAVTQWEGVLRRQANVAGASFTSSAVARRGSVPAGVHEKYMFDSIADQARSAIAVVFERSVDVSTMLKAVAGFEHYAIIAHFYAMTGKLNHLVIMLAKYLLKAIDVAVESSGTSSTNPAVPIDTSVLDTPIHLLRSAGATRAIGSGLTYPSLPNQAYAGGAVGSGAASGAAASPGAPALPASAHHDRTAHGAWQSPSPFVDSPARYGGGGSGSGSGGGGGGGGPSGGGPSGADQGGSGATGAAGETLRADARSPNAAEPLSLHAHRATLTLHTVFTLAARFCDSVHEGWSNIVECILRLHALDALPTDLVAIEDFRGVSGAPLPSIGGLGSSASSSTSAAASSSSASARNAQAAAEAGSVWSSLTSFLWSTDDTDRGMNAAALAAIQDAGKRAPIHVLVSQSHQIHDKALAHFMNALIRARDPLLPANVVESVLVLELLTGITLRNSHRVDKVWPLLHAHVRRVLAANPQGLEFLMERVVVSLLHACLIIGGQGRDTSEIVRPTLQLLVSLRLDTLKIVATHVAAVRLLCKCPVLSCLPACQCWLV